MRAGLAGAAVALMVSSGLAFAGPVGPLAQPGKGDRVDVVSEAPKRACHLRPSPPAEPRAGDQYERRHLASLVDVLRGWRRAG